MEFHEWEPVYRAILADFDYDRTADERSRDRLDALLSARETLDLTDLSFDGKSVAIAGAAPTLTEEIDRVEASDVVIAASTAASVLVDAGVGVDCVVTDLDGDPERARELAHEGTAVAVHAHGDNDDLMEQYVPAFSPEVILPTTQAAPAGRVVNPGGFTDGDRAAFLADHCGADELVFPGWDFDDSTVGPEKARKLAWAERLLYWLERRRGDRFDVLDGRRDDVDADPFDVG